jgi:hypothetical protein
LFSDLPYSKHCCHHVRNPGIWSFPFCNLWCSLNIFQLRHLPSFAQIGEITTAITVTINLKQKSSLNNFDDVRTGLAYREFRCWRHNRHHYDIFSASVRSSSSDILTNWRQLITGTAYEREGQSC